MKRLSAFALACAFALCALSHAAARAQGAQLTVEEILKIRRVGDPQLSPDGKWIAYTVSVPDVDANRSRTHIYRIPSTGGEPKQLTDGDSSASAPRWSPDGRKIAYVTRGQIWLMDADGSDKKQLTKISLGASDPVWSPDSRMIAFASDVYPECRDDKCNERRAAEAEANKVKAKVADRLLYRHWDAWKDNKRAHVFIANVSNGEARDVTPGDFDAPPFSLGGPTDYAFSPDSKELAFARNTDKDEALSTNSDIFIVPVAGGEAKRLTGANRGADQSPQYSPDGRYIAYRSQTTAGFESDRWRLMLYERETGRTRELLPRLDSHVEGFAFAPDSSSVYFVTGERGRHPIYVAGVADGRTSKVLEGFNDDVKVSPDARFLVFTRTSSIMPSEIFMLRLDGVAPPTGASNQAVQLTRENDEFMRRFKLHPAEELTWTGAGRAKVSGWLFKPPDFDPSRKYPLLVLIHGGPQSAWNDAWSYRWNPQVFASQGYVTFLPNPRGSATFGQQFMNEISGDWGGKVFTDIMNGVAKVAAMPYVDKNRIGAAGASYGGYMVNWILGHNTDPRFRFRTLVSHAGVFNLTSMYGATEELWFTEWEFKGTPWTNPAMYERWSPHRFATNFKTPTLITHGELDYRVPVGESLQLFTYLQRMNVPSKLVVFPDEGHWILKPQNSRFWYKTVIDWLDQHLKPGS